MDVLMIRYHGEDQQGLGKGLGVEEEQQGRPQQEGDHVRLGCDSISGSRTVSTKMDAQDASGLRLRRT
jgi:hypothetical protein